jgi:hypothetical protein
MNLVQQRHKPNHLVITSIKMITESPKTSRNIFQLQSIQKQVNL